MKKIAIYGAGGFGKETELLIRQINAHYEKWEFIGFFDDHVKSGLGGLKELNHYQNELHLVIAIANSETRKDIANNITNENVKFTNLVHPSVIISCQDVSIGEGCIIGANTVFTVDCHIGNHVIINLACTLGHDIVLNDFCSVMPGVHISGNVRIGESTLVGTGAVILQNVSVGNNCIIGAGAVVTKDIRQGCQVVGIPAKTTVK